MMMAVVQQFDPEKDDDAAEEAAAVAAFAQNPDDISMEFPGENEVCLHVSDAYQAYAAEMGYTAYLYFFWTKNAFLIDYLADTIRGEGYQLGIISSKDGFVRCLDETGEKRVPVPAVPSFRELNSVTWNDDVRGTEKHRIFPRLPGGQSRYVPLLPVSGRNRCAHRILARQTEKTTRQHPNLSSIPVNMAVLIAACSIFLLSGRIAFRGVPENTGFTENLQRLV